MTDQEVIERVLARPDAPEGLRRALALPEVLPGAIAAARRFLAARQ